MPLDPNKFAHTADFNMLYGWFYQAWAVMEAAIDCAIGKFLRLSHEEAHILTAGMPHGRKCQLLESLISRSSHPNKSELLRTLHIVQNESMRNQFAHSYIASETRVVTFIKRSHTGPYKAQEYNFTAEEFKAHIDKFMNAAAGFATAMQFQELELQAFQHAALSASKKG